MFVREYFKNSIHPYIQTYLFVDLLVTVGAKRKQCTTNEIKVTSLPDSLVGLTVGLAPENSNTHLR